MEFFRNLSETVKKNLGVAAAGCRYYTCIQVAIKKDGKFFGINNI